MNCGILALHRLDQFDAELNLARCTLVADRIEEAELVAPVALGLVHGRIRVLQQRAHVAAVLGEERHADRRRNLGIDVRNKVGPVQRLRNPLGKQCDFLAVHELADQHDELVTAEPRDGSVIADRLAQHVGGGLDQGVTDKVPQCVVDILETIEVDQHGRHASLAIRRGHDHVAHRLAQQVAIRQASQRVVPREVLDASLGLLALRGLHRQCQHQASRVREARVILIPVTNLAVLQAQHPVHCALDENGHVEQRADVSPHRIAGEHRCQPRRPCVVDDDRLPVHQLREVHGKPGRRKFASDPVAQEAVGAAVEQGLATQDVRFTREAPEAGRSDVEHFGGRTQHRGQGLREI